MDQTAAVRAGGIGKSFGEAVALDALDLATLCPEITLPGATTTVRRLQLDVTADGRYVADGDGLDEVDGFFRVRAPYGDAPDPLWQFDGAVDLLNPSGKD